MVYCGFYSSLDDQQHTLGKCAPHVFDGSTKRSDSSVELVDIYGSFSPINIVLPTKIALQLKNPFLWFHPHTHTFLYVTFSALSFLNTTFFGIPMRDAWVSLSPQNIDLRTSKRLFTSSLTTVWNWILYPMRVWWCGDFSSTSSCHFDRKIGTFPNWKTIAFTQCHFYTMTCNNIYFFQVLYSSFWKFFMRKIKS